MAVRSPLARTLTFFPPGSPSMTARPLASVTVCNVAAGTLSTLVEMRAPGTGRSSSSTTNTESFAGSPVVAATSGSSSRGGGATIAVSSSSGLTTAPSSVLRGSSKRLLTTTKTRTPAAMSTSERGSFDPMRVLPMTLMTLIYGSAHASGPTQFPGGQDAGFPHPGHGGLIQDAHSV